MLTLKFLFVNTLGKKAYHECPLQYKIVYPSHDSTVEVYVAEEKEHIHAKRMTMNQVNSHGKNNKLTS